MFDQSVSMRNDQKEIRERINKVYAELGLADAAAGDHLLTAIASYGSGYLTHTRKTFQNQFIFQMFPTRDDNFGVCLHFSVNL